MKNILVAAVLFAVGCMSNGAPITAGVEEQGLSGQTETHTCDTNCTNDSDCHPSCGAQYHCSIGVGWQGTCVMTKPAVTTPVELTPVDDGPSTQKCGIDCVGTTDCPAPACNYCAKPNPWVKGNCISGVALSPEERQHYDEIQAASLLQ